MKTYKIFFARIFGARSLIQLFLEKNKINSTSKNGYNMYRGWTKIDYQDKHCTTDQTDKGT
jgi:hypothetical protein